MSTKSHMPIALIVPMIWFHSLTIVIILLLRRRFFFLSPACPAKSAGARTGAGLRIGGLFLLLYHILGYNPTATAKISKAVENF